MKRVIRSFIVITILFLSINSASAQTSSGQNMLDTSGLKPEQVKALNDLAIQLRREPENTLANLTLQNTTPDRFKEWADAGAAAGKAVSSFTHEIGIAADQFLQTDVGRISLYALLWKFGGNKIVENSINLVSDLILAIILYTFWWKLTRRFVMNERRIGTTEYNQNTILRWLGFNKKSVVYEKDESWIANMNSNDRFWVYAITRILSAFTIILITWLCWPEVRF